MSRPRSPNYPGRDLGGAIQDAQALYEKEGRTAFAGSVAATAWKYKSFSGPARVRLAALKQYGLLDQKKGGEAKLSERALTLILMNASHTEWKNAVRAAALAPPIFNELFHDKLSASDTSIKHTLVVGKNFTDEGATNCIRVWRATIEFARLDEHAEQVLQDEFNRDNVSGSDEDRSRTETEQKNEEFQVGDYVQWLSQDACQFPVPLPIVAFSDDRTHAYFEGSQTGVPLHQLEKCQPPQGQEPPINVGGQTMSSPVPNSGPRQIGAAIPVTPDCSISIMAIGCVTQEAVDNLVKYLQLFKGSFPKTVTVDPPKE